MFRHILPNVLAPVIVLATLGMASAILTGASLSFLGLGAQPPSPEWGAMLSAGRDYLRSAWWISTLPGAGDHDRGVRDEPRAVTGSATRSTHD